MSTAAEVPLSVALATGGASAEFLDQLIDMTARSDSPAARLIEEAAIRAVTFRAVFRAEAARRGLPGDL